MQLRTIKHRYCAARRRQRLLTRLIAQAITASITWDDSDPTRIRGIIHMSRMAGQAQRIRARILASH